MYHQLVHLLDLCTYSYQLHNQTLIWPMDPYYDQLSGIKGRRNGFMAEVHKRAGSGAHYVGMRGPDVLTDPQTHHTNRDLDPIISDYSKINPWQPSVVRPNRETEDWILYDTSYKITNRIAEAWLVCYNAGSPRPVAPPAKLNQRLGTDWLYCFEGGTGAIVRKATTAAWSLMGFVLAREDETAPNPPPGRPYDLYIVFRGSRSGDPRALRALFKERGNPDWISDMDFGAGRDVVENNSDISETGHVSPGFAASVSTMLPTVMVCLKDIQNRKKYAPRTIYVTGHSLAAALAVHFTSAVLLGGTYGYTVSSQTGGKMPDDIRGWPWSGTQLVPFALPVVGDESFRDAFNITLASRPVYLSGDPVTQRRRQYGVGRPYRIVPESASNLDQRGARISALRHEPFNIRKYLIKDLEKRGIKLHEPPREPWETYPNLKELLSTRRKSYASRKVSEILGPDFNARLLKYLGVLHERVSANQKPKVNILIAAIEAIEAMKTPAVDLSGKFWVMVGSARQQWSLEEIYSQCKGMFPAGGASKSDRNDFNNFIGLCLFLSAASELTYKEADELARKSPFDELPFT
jgi:Lipase (class 3)